MAQYTAYANYVIYFSNPADYDLAVLTAGGNNWLHSPQNAATTFGLTYPVPGGPLGVKGMYSLGSGTGQWDVNPPGTAILFPGPTGLLMNPAVDSVLVPGQASPPVSSIPGPDMLLIWCGAIVRVGGAQVTPSPNPIPQRRWFGGLEVRSLGEGGTGLQFVGSRDSSRTIDGIGFPIRQNLTAGIWLRTINELRPGLVAFTSRERLYVRWRTGGLPTTNYRFWRSHGTISNNCGGGIKLNTNGTLSIVSIDAGNTETLRGTSSIVLVADQWYLLDIFIDYIQDAINVQTNLGFTVFANHAGIGLSALALNIGVLGISHVSSEIGDSASLSDATAEIDLDDWISTDPNPTADSIDFFVGSHVRRRFITGFGPTQGTWAGQFQSLNQGHQPSGQIGSTVTSSTAGAILDGVTDYINDEQDSIGQVLGCVGEIVSLFSNNVGGTDGTLGYSHAGGAAVMISVNQLNADSYVLAPYLPSGMITPTSITPVRILHAKSADANLDTVTALNLLTEELGTWGLEDDPATIPIPRVALIHNAYYPNTIWGYVGPVPDGPCSAFGAVYVGNGTTLTVNLPDLCHMIMVRPLTGSSNGWRWFGASLGGHLGIKEQMRPNSPVRVLVDSTGQCKFVVVGTDAQVNAVGVSYQVIAFCDPGLRYNLCGAYLHSINQVTKNNILVDANFTPLAGFIQQDVMSASGFVTMAYKGPGAAGVTGRFLDGSAAVNFGSFAAGIFTTRASIHSGGPPSQFNYSLWRTIDGSGFVMVQILSYTGNGSNPRNITLTPTSGRFPLLAMVVPQNGADCFQRDPSHAGANSINCTFNTTVANAITGGAIDRITVDSALNANGVVYDVFVIPGDTAGWNNGTFRSPNFRAGGTNGTEWLAPVFNPPDGPVIQGEGGLILGGDPALGLLRDISGIYTIIPNQFHDALIDRQPGVTGQNVKIPDPYIKTGYIGG